MNKRWSVGGKPARLGLLALLLAGLLFGTPAGSPAAASVNVPTLSYLPLIYHFYPVGDVSVNRVEVVQGITMGDSYTVHVAHRPALLRVFVSLTGPDHLDGVTARLTRYVGGVAQDALLAGPATIYAATNEGNLSQTLNFSLPDAWLAAGTSYVVELDHANTLTESNETNNRFPGGGAQSFDFVNVPTLEVVIVPVQYARPGASTSVPDTGNLDYLTWMPFKLYPVSQINYTVHGTVTFNGDLRYTTNGGQGWVDLLNVITAIHASEDPAQHKLYYGLVDSVGVDGCGGGCIAGIGWVNQQFGVYSKTSLGFAGFPGARSEASPTFTHEMGHNFGRRHSPCGTTNGLGPYPYGVGAPIGQWGYDPASGLMYNPSTYKDYMSYCGPEWTSDFTYRALYEAWAWALNPYGQDVATSEALVYSGLIGADGVPQVDSAFIERAPVAQLTDRGGQYRLDVLDAAGQVLASQAFTPVQIAVDRQGGAPNMPNLTADLLGFRVVVPVVEGAAGLRLTHGAEVLWERQVSGAKPDLSAATVTAAGDGGLAWSAGSGRLGVSYRVSFSPDGGQTWTLLQAAGAAPQVTVPAELLAGAREPIIEVQASDGLRVTRRTYAATDGAAP
jgi:hypothetical protein